MPPQRTDTRGEARLRAPTETASMGALKISGLFSPRALAGWLMLLPAGLMVVCIAHYGVNVPFVDDWDLSPLVSKAVHRKVVIKHLFQQHNEHRVFFLNLIVALSAWGSHWDLRLQMYLSVVFCGLTACNLSVLIKRTLSVSSKGQAALGLGMGALIFSPVQYENWLWGFQVAFFLVPLCFSTSWVVLTSNLRLGAKFAVAAVLTTIATFSFSTGVFGWLLSFPLFVITTGIEGRKAIRWLGCWFGAAAVCMGIYLYGYQQAGHSTRILTGFHPFLYAEYAMVFLGGNIFRGIGIPPTMLPFIMGLFVTVLYLVLLWYVFRRNGPTELRRRSAPWAGFGAFAIASAALCAIGRRPYSPVGQALESRYTTFSLMLVVSLVGLTFLVYRHFKTTVRDRAAKMLPWLAGAGIAVGYALSMPNSFEQMSKLRSFHLDGKAALQYSRVLRDPQVAEAIMTATLYPDIGALRRFVVTLDAVDCFRPPLVNDPSMHDDSLASGNKKKSWGRVDSIGIEGNEYVVSGWAVLLERHERADGIVLASLNSAGQWIPLTVAGERTERSDINAMVGNRSLKNAGWRARVPRAALPPEAHEVSAWAIDGRTGESYKLEGSQNLPKPTS